MYLLLFEANSYYSHSNGNLQKASFKFRVEFYPSIEKILC
jgi:hypothetical protein